jgi:hypothetical protein
VVGGRRTALAAPDLARVEVTDLAGHGTQEYGGDVSAYRWAVAAVVMTVVGAVAAPFVPITEFCMSTGAGTETCGSESLFAMNGAWVFVVVAILVLVALLPVLAPGRLMTLSSAVLLWVGCVAGLVTVGRFFVPAAILMTVAAARDDGPSRVRRGHCSPRPGSVLTGWI